MGYSAASDCLGCDNRALQLRSTPVLRVPEDVQQATGWHRAATISCVLCGPEQCSSAFSRGADTMSTILLWMKGGVNSGRPERSDYSQRSLQKGHPQMALVQLLKAVPQDCFCDTDPHFWPSFSQERRLCCHTICLSARPPQRASVPLVHCGRSVQGCNISYSLECRVLSTLG